MIENDEQLAATLEYITKWADALEGMRQYELQAKNGLFASLADGPLGEIRKNLELANAYVNRDDATQSLPFENAGKPRQNDFTTVRLPEKAGSKG